MKLFSTHRSKIMYSFIFSLTVLTILAVSSSEARNYPHDTNGKTFPAFLEVVDKTPQPTRKAVSKKQLYNVKSTDVKVQARPMMPDARGTKVDSVFTFTADVQEDLIAPEKDYNVVFYVDDKPVRQFDNVRLPFSFSRDFRGRGTGTYKVRLDIEDLEGNVVASQTTQVSVRL